MQADGLLDGPVVIQEKIDGSQFSFGNLNGELHARSKGVQIGIGGNCEGMFKKAYRAADLIFRTGTIPEGMVIRGETLDKPKHNTLAYSRVPTGNVIIFDITPEDGTERYLAPNEVRGLADKWGLECVPILFSGEVTAPEIKKLWETDWSQRESVLGGAKIEGVVIKNYSKVDGMGKLLCCKLVRDDFKEANTENWKAQQPGSIIERLILSFNKEAIWEKAIQHARDDGKLLGEAKDIGYLIGTLKKDFHEEHSERIKKEIFKEFYSDIERRVMKGFPEFYKAQLLDKALGGKTDG
jgi:ATP-dependent RNA circularization protein (DNA/RNA ligase family)